MCIAIFKPKNVILTKAVLKTCFENNPDGAGVAFPSLDGSSVVVEKGFFTFKDFWQAYKNLKERPMLIHFRVATSGKIDIKNCHPWRINNKHALIHNGILQNKIGRISKDCSDTGLFVRLVLKPTFSKNEKIWKTSAYKWMMEKTIGFKNKIALMNNLGEVVIFNKNQGKEEHGCWFSNETYKKARKTTATLQETWIEEKGGSTIIATRKGSTVNYVYVNNPLELESKTKKSKESIIFDFVKNQTKVDISLQKTVSLQESLDALKKEHDIDLSMVL